MQAGIQPLATRLLRGSLMVTAGNVASRLLSVVVGVWLARTLSQAEFGEFGILQGTINLFTMLGTMSLGLAVTKSICGFRRTDPVRARVAGANALLTCVVSSTFTAILLFLLRQEITQHILKNPRLTSLMFGASVVLLLTGVGSITGGLLTGLERFGAVAASTIIQNILLLILSIAWVPSARVQGGLVATVLATAAATGYALWAARTVWWPISFTSVRLWWAHDLKQYASFCLPLFIGGLAQLAAGWWVMALLSRRPGGYEQVALLSAADRVRTLQLFVGGFIGTASFPVLASVAADKDPNSASIRGTELGITASALLVAPLCAALALTGPLCMGIFGGSYAADWSVLLPAVAWGGAVNSSTIVLISLWAHNYVKPLLWIPVVSSGVLIAAGFMFGHSAVGVGVANCFAASTYSVLVIAAGYTRGILSRRALATSCLALIFSLSLPALVPIIAPQYRTMCVLPISFAVMAAVAGCGLTARQIRTILQRASGLAWRCLGRGAVINQNA